MERAVDVSCLREQGAQRYANTYIYREVGQPIVALRPRDMIGQTFYGPTPSIVDINTLEHLT